MLKYKDGVTGEPAAALSDALVIVERVYEWFGMPNVTVTAIRNGSHKPGSLHGRGYACDVRTSDVKMSLHAPLAAALKAELGPAFDVVLETNSTPGASAQHIHIEFDPEHNGGKNLP